MTERAFDDRVGSEYRSEYRLREGIEGAGVIASKAIASEETIGGANGF